VFRTAEHSRRYATLDDPKVFLLSGVTPSDVRLRCAVKRELGREVLASAEELAHAWWLGWSEALHGWTLLDLRVGSKR
jgi:hypothetical protein